MLSNGRHTFRNYLMFRIWPLNRIAEWRWSVPAERVEGANLPDARAIKQAVSIPVLCNGGFQSASVIEAALGAATATQSLLPGHCSRTPTSSSSTRLATNGHLGRARTATSVFNVLEHPIGCYDESRYDSREEMIREIFSVFEPVAGPVPQAREPGRLT